MTVYSASVYDVYCTGLQITAKLSVVPSQAMIVPPYTGLLLGFLGDRLQQPGASLPPRRHLPHRVLQKTLAHLSRGHGGEKNSQKFKNHCSR